MRRGVGVLAALALSAMLAACVTGPADAPAKEFKTVWPAPPAEPRFYFEKTLRSSGDVIEETTADRFKRLATGQSLSGKGLQKPYGVAAKYGTLYVSDTAARRVAAFDFINKSYFEIGTEGVGTLAKPLGLAIDGTDHLYVVDGTGKRVVVFTLDGTYVKTMGGQDILNRPTGIAVTPDGQRIYVVDTGGVDTTDHRVVVFGADGSHLFDIGTRGSGDGEFNLPLNAAMATEPELRLLVVDGGNFRIQGFRPDGQFLFDMGDIGRRSGQFARPKGIAVDPQGKVYVSDAAFGNVQIFTPQGELLMWIGERGLTAEPGAFLLPAGVAVDPTDGRLYLADQYYRKVEIYRPVETPFERDPAKGRPGAASTS